MVTAHRRSRARVALAGPSLAVGCPALARDWIIFDWFAHIDAAVRSTGSLDVEDCVAIIVCDTRRDHATAAAFVMAAREHGWHYRLRHCDELRRSDRREWGPDRYTRMAALRNTLLDDVRRVGPDWFWSVDSDVLVAKRALASALDAAGHGFDAVGSRCYMTSSGTGYPSNVVELQSDDLRRLDSDQVLTVDALMAVKLLSPRAYQVDYRMHRRGEDIGWSIAARSSGCVLGWDGRVVSKHVMEPALLRRVDSRCGF